MTAHFESWSRLQLVPDSYWTIGVTSNLAPDGEPDRHRTHVVLTVRPKLGSGDVTWNMDIGLGHMTSKEQKRLFAIFSRTVAGVPFHPQEAAAGGDKS